MSSSPSASPPERSRTKLRATLLTLVLTLAGMLSLPALPAAALPYPNPLPNFASGQPGGMLNQAGGRTPRKVLVIFVRLDNATPDPAQDAAWLQQRYFGGLPSVRDYYQTVSGGRLQLTPLAETDGTPNDGVVTVEGGDAATFLQGGDPSSSRMNRRALQLAGSVTDFAAADSNGDGQVTTAELSVSVVWSNNPLDGGRRARGHDAITLDGKIMALTSVTMCATNCDLMTVIHEVHHVLIDGRDLYGYGVGRYSLKGYTSGPDNQLQIPTVYEKMQLGWSYPTVVTRDGYYDIPRSDRGHGGFLLYDPDKGTNDYLMVENRQPTPNTYDAAGPDRGLLVWRIVNGNYGIDSATRRVIELVKPTASDPFPCVPGNACYLGTAQDAWDPSDPSTPQRTVQVPWAGDTTTAGVAIRAISPSSDTMRAFFDVPGPGVLTDCFTEGGRRLSAGRPNLVPVTVRNTGSAQDTFRFRLSGLPIGWLTSGPRELSLAPGEERTVDLDVTPPVGARSPLNVTVSGVSTADWTVSSSCDIRLEPQAGPGSWAYLWADDPTAWSYIPNNRYQRSSNGQLASILKTGTGDYSVLLPGLAVAGGTVNVTGYGNAVACRALSLPTPRGVDLEVRVGCLDPGGVFTDSSFTFSFTAPAEDAGEMAHVVADEPWRAQYTPNLRHSYNSQGGANTVSRSAPGNYVVRLDRLASSGGHVQVTPLYNEAASCAPVWWWPSGSTEVVRVTCHGLDGAYADSSFTLSYVKNGALTGEQYAHDSAYLWSGDDTGANPAPDPGYAWSSAASGMTVNRTEPGRYTVTLEALAGDGGGTVHVTPYGDTTTQCSVSEWHDVEKAEQVELYCFGPKGEPVDARFNLAFIR